MKTVGNEKTPRRHAFEVTLHVKGAEPVILYSKLKMGCFPKANSVLSGMQTFVNTGSAPPMRKMKESNCVIS